MKNFIFSLLLALACVTGLSAAPEPPPPPDDEICMDLPVVSADGIEMNADFLPMQCAGMDIAIKSNSFPDPCFLAPLPRCLAPIPLEHLAEFNSNRQRSNNGSTLQKDPGNPVTITAIGAFSCGGLARLQSCKF